MISILLIDLAILVALVAFGYVLARLILGASGPLETASLAFPLGGGVFTWLLFLLSWGGMNLSIETVVVTYGASMMTAIVLINVRGRRNLEAPQKLTVVKDGSSKWPARAFWVLMSIFLLVAMALAVGRSHSHWDAAATWIIKGYGIALGGGVRAAGSWGAWGLAQALNIPLLASLHRMATADVLPGSMLMFPVFAFSVATGIYWFWRKNGVDSWARLLGVGLLVANPLVMLHSTIGYANLPTATYVVLGACWMIEGLNLARKEYVLLGSLLFGLASWTRSDAVAYGLLAIPMLIMVYWLARKARPTISYSTIPFAIIAVSWALFSWSNIEQSHLGGAVRGVLPSLLAGEFKLWELQLIPRLLMKRALLPDTWGLLFPVVGLLIVLGARKLIQFPKRPHYAATFMATIVICLIPMGFFYVNSFTTDSLNGFAALLHRSFDRAFLPGAIMLLVLGFLLALGDDKDNEFLPDRSPERTGHLSTSDQAIIP